LFVRAHAVLNLDAELLNADWQRDTWIGLRLHSRPRLEQASNILRESEPGLAAN